MIYIEHIPAAPLNCCIRSLWYARVNSASHSRERILPTGRIQIILNLARDFLLDCPDGQPAQPTAPALVVGARSRYEMVDTADMADLIGVVFHPGGFAPFARDSVDLFSNRSVGLDDLWGGAAEPLRDRLRELATPPERLQCLEGFLRQVSPHSSRGTALSTLHWIGFNVHPARPRSMTLQNPRAGASGASRRFFANKLASRPRPGRESSAFSGRCSSCMPVQMCHGPRWLSIAATTTNRTSPTNSAPSPASTRQPTWPGAPCGPITCRPIECPVSKLPVNP